MEDIIDIIVTETTNLIEITSQPTDEIIDVNIIDNREDVTLNVTPTVVEININSLTGNFGVNWGEIAGTLSNQTDLQNALNLKADLVGGKVPSSQLPSYVDDVVEVANYASLPATGETGKIYVVLDTNLIYRWSGSAYIEIKDSSAVWGAITGTLSSQTDLQNALNAKANDNAVVHLAGTETITGAKTFSSAVTAPNFVLSGGTGNTGLYYGHTDRVVLANYTAGGIDFEVNGGFIVATLFPSGNYGLGITLDAGYKLDVNGTARISGALSGTSASFSSSITSSSIIKSGGTSSQFLKADGSVDSTSYQPLLTNPVTGTGTSGIVAVFNGTSSITDSTIYANSTRVSIGADVTTTNRFTAVSSTTSAYAIVAQASSAAHGIWSNVLGSGEIFRGQTAGGSYFIINNGGNAFLNGNLNVGDFASTSYRLNVVGTANFTGALSGTSATFTSNVTIRPSAGYNAYFQTSGTSVRINYLNDALSANVGAAFRATDYSFQDSTGSPVFTIASTGAATFSSSVTAGVITSSVASGTGTLKVNNSSVSKAWSFYPTTNGSQTDITLYEEGTSANVMTFRSGGNVGIGTTSPTGKLQIETTSGSTLLRLSAAAVNTKYLYTLTGGADDAFTLSRDHPTGGGLDIMTWTYSGKVGIRTTSPNGGLTVVAPSSSTAISLWGRAGDNYSALRFQSNTGATTYSTIYTNASDLIFENGGSERMRITSGGNVLIGTTTDAGEKLRVNGNLRALSLYASDAGLSAGNWIRLGHDDNVGFIDVNRAINSGDLHFRFDNTSRANINRTTGIYMATSDSRLKTNILDSQNVLSVIDKIKVRSYNWIENNAYEPYGLIAQELNEILPEYVYKPKTESESWGISKAELVPVLIKAIQELKSKIETLENK